MTDCKRSILLLAYYYLPATTSGVQRAARMARYLPRHGYVTYVVSSSESGTAGLPDIIHVPDESTVRSAGRLTRLAAGVQRILPYDEKLPWVPHVMEAAGTLIGENNISAVISTSPPVGTHLAAMWLKRRYGLHWVADFRDPIVGNPGRARPWAQGYDQILERSIFEAADAVLTVTDVIANEWRNRHPHCARKIHLVWNGFDPEEAMGPAPVPSRQYRTLAHVGVLYGPRQPTSLLASLARLIDRGRISPAGIRLRFVGPIQDETSFLSDPALQSLQRRGCVEVCGHTVPRSAALQEIATSDSLLLLDIADLANHGYAVPAKLHDYVRAGRPILGVTPEHSPVDRILSMTGLPYLCVYPPDSPDTIDSKLLTFLNLPSDPITPTQCYFETFDGQRLVSNIASILNGLYSP